MSTPPRPREDMLERLKRFRHGQRGWALFILSAPLLLTAILGLAAGNLGVVGGAGAGWAIIVAATIAMRRGFSAEAEGAPAPRRLRSLTAAAVGLGTGLAALFGAGHAIAVSLLFGGAAAVAVRLLYGPDPAPPAPAPEPPPPSSDAALLDAARTRIARLEAAALAVPQRDFAEAIGRIASLARRIVAEAASDAADLRRARRFLTIYLEGAEAVANRYVATHRDMTAPELETNFRTLLGDLETAFSGQLAALKQSDTRALDIDIAVLQARLREEGMTEERVPR